MERVHIDVTRDLDRESVVHACFDLSERELAASTRAVAAVAAERFRMRELSADDVLELRELTALSDELGESTGGGRTLVMRPARLSAYRGAVADFVESRTSSEWISEEDRELLAPLDELVAPLEQLCAQTMHAALFPSEPAR